MDLAEAQRRREKNMDNPSEAIIGDLAPIWEKLDSQKPQGTEITLSFSADYAFSDVSRKHNLGPYTNRKFRVAIHRPYRADSTRDEIMPASGSGDTPELAIAAAIEEFHIQNRRIRQSELNQFRAWRAAKARRRRHVPSEHSRPEDWDAAVKQTKRSTV
jgi:hypothetical protein